MKCWSASCTCLLLCFCLFLPALRAQGILYQYQHQKISSKAGNFKEKLRRYDHFGRGLALLPDLDGDGVDELAVGATGNDEAGENSGAVYILFLNRSGKVRASQKIRVKEGNVAGKLQSQGQFGWAITCPGDLDGDGTADLAVGEPGRDEGGRDAGAVWLLLLKPNGEVKSSQKISRLEGDFQGGTGPGFRFGAALASLQGAASRRVLAVGTDMQNDAAKGEIWLLFLNQQGSVESQLKITEGTAGFPYELRAGDRFGSALASLGDLDGDGRPELAVGAPGDGDGGAQTGAVYVLFFDEHHAIKKCQKLSTQHGGLTARLDNQDYFGCAVAGIGDLNGDGIPDLAVGSSQDDDGSPNRGAVWICYLRQDGSVKAHEKISETTPNFRGELAPRYQWASALSPLGDLNQNGLPDLAVSGHLDQDGGKEKGAVWLLFPTGRPGAGGETGKRPAPPPAGPPGKPAAAQAPPTELTADPGQAAGDTLPTEVLDYDLSHTAPNHLVLLLDVSASMRKADKLPLLQQAVLQLLPHMRPEDRLSIITYSGKPRLVLNAMPATRQDSIAQRIQSLTSKGSTKPFKALKKAYRHAGDHFLEQGNNRIILATDGGFDIPALYKLTQKYGSKTLPLSVFYFGKLPGYKIEQLQQLAAKGYGNCAHIQPRSAQGALLREVKAVRR